MSLSIDVDVNDHFSDDELAEYLEEKGQICQRKSKLSLDDDSEKSNGITVNYGQFLKDVQLAQALEDAFHKYEYKLVDKLKLL